jgi:hypothetical protein
MGKTDSPCACWHMLAHIEIIKINWWLGIKSVIHLFMLIYVYVFIIFVLFLSYANSRMFAAIIFWGVHVES